MSSQVVYLVWRKSFNDNVSLYGVYSEEDKAREVSDEVYENNMNSWVTEATVDEEISG